MIYAMLPVILDVKHFVDTFKPEVNDSDFDKLEVYQRSEIKPHVEQFSNTVQTRLKQNPNVPPLETVITVRVIPHAKKHKALMKALLTGKVNVEEMVEKSLINDGQHRYLRAKHDMDNGMVYSLIFNLILCDDEDEADIFYNVNGPARKMGPAIMDLALAKKFKNGTIDESKRVRGIQSLIAHNFVQLNNHPYKDGRIEQPFKRPPYKGTTAMLKFHRTAGSMRPIAAAINKDETLSVEKIDKVSRDVSTVWQALELLLEDEVFGIGASYLGTGENDVPIETEDWAHAHLFGILNEVLVTKIVVDNYQLPPLKVLDVAAKIKKTVADFFKWGKTDSFFASGFRGLGGNSNDLRYMQILKGMMDTYKV